MQVMQVMQVDQVVSRINLDDMHSENVWFEWL